MHLTIIGTGTVAPWKDRASPAYWVEAGAVCLLMDCGAGALHHAATLGIPWHTVTHVAITHFHPDHWSDLPGLLYALRYGIEPARTEPLQLVGPRGLKPRLTLLAGAFGDTVMDPGYSLGIVELAPGERRTLENGVELETCATAHTEESVAYAVRADGARLVYTGDTGPSEELARWAAGCDLLLAECSLPDNRALDLHLTPSRVGALARTARAGKLVLTHFYPVFGDADPVALAAQEYDGPIVAARDGDRFGVGT